jgi:hypothetical protein
MLGFSHRISPKLIEYLTADLMSDRRFCLAQIAGMDTNPKNNKQRAYRCLKAHNPYS